MTQKTNKTVYQISQYTTPQTAAIKIINKFGIEFAEDLASELFNQLSGQNELLLHLQL